MAYYTEVSFQGQYFISRFEDACKNSHEYALQTTLSSLQGSPVWIDAFVEHVTDSLARIVTNSVQAFIKAFGSGRYADISSPFWDAYTQSDVFNKRRGKSNAVLYRNQPYSTYDWKNDSRSLIDRHGGKKTGEWKSFPAVSGDPNTYYETLDLYQKFFFQYFNENELLNLQTELRDSFQLEVKNV